MTPLASLTASLLALTLGQTPAPTPGGVPDYFGSANWGFSPPLRKFVDTLPGLGAANANNLGQYLSVAYPDTVTYPGSDYYEIELRQFQERMHSDLPPTTLRGYVQVNRGTDANGSNTIEPDPIHYLGPVIIAQKDRPVRIKFTNALPTGAGGDLFIPVDTSIMGAGKGPLGESGPNFTQNRATLHLHGGRTPWISDGTPHQWITPAGEDTPYPKGVSVSNVPDMPDPGDGSMTFFYTNQQSARLLFYHDHSFGITRLNVYAGEAAGYLIVDDVERQLIADGIVPADQIPLIIQDKTFVDAATVRQTDPTWNWGTGAPDQDGVRPPVTGDLWYPHVYSPAQNPYDLGGVNAFGRWHYGPWFWPPTTNITHPPIPNPYYDPVNAPWQPPEMPATPNPSIPGESFMDTQVVNGTAFPTLTVEPKSYRLRILNASNDRSVNLQLYVADSTVTSADGRTDTEVKMVPAIPNPLYPPSWPTDGREGGVPDPATAGPSFIQIGTEAGFLPAPAVIPNQPIAWNLDPTTFNFGNVSDHALLLAAAERADVIVDFSQFAGKTLIFYNDAPAAFPALDARLDYYTGAPDLTDTGGHPGPQAGFGPNTRTVMQIKVAASAPAAAFDLARLEAAFVSTPEAPGVFARGQDPIVVGQSAYDSAYNKTFPATWPNWGLSRIQDNTLSFETISGVQLTVPMEPKAIQDEMGEAFDMEYGRMSGKLGLELPSTNAGNQNFVLQNFVDPPTEIVKAEPLIGEPVAGDGTQIWKITHNGVDTHPVHFHAFDVQVINRVGWDGAIRLPDANELGWKDTVRVSPLEDTIVALRAVQPMPPFGVPDSVRPLNPAEPIGSMMGFTNLDPTTGQAIVPPVTNQLVNFGWEYVWHCHILTHEEDDFMRPITLIVDRALATPPVLTILGTSGSNVDLGWTDPTPATDPATLGNPANEIGFRIERATGTTGQFERIGTALANGTSHRDTAASAGTYYRYRVVAYNAAGEVMSNVATVGPPPPAAPTGLAAVAAAYDQIDLTWTDNAANELGFQIERADVTGGVTGAFALLQTVGPDVTSYSDTSVQAVRTYAYRVIASNATGLSDPSNTATVTTPQVPPPAAPTGLTAVATPIAQVDLTWVDGSTIEQGFRVERAPVTNGTPGSFATIVTLAANAASYTDTSTQPSQSYEYRVVAFNAGGTGTSGTVQVTTPALAPPAAPSGAVATPSALGPNPPTVTLTWTDNAGNEAGFTIQRARSSTFTTGLTTFTVGANVTSYLDTTVGLATQYWYRVRATNTGGTSAWAAAAPVTTAGQLPAAPANLRVTATATNGTTSSATLAWNAVPGSRRYYLERSTDGATWTRIATPTTTSYVNAGLTPGATYSYRVQAVNAYGAGPFSAVLQVTAP
jgi:FtsP/CotA-like multicopper oxidase with cupredoxin domain